MVRSKKFTLVVLAAITLCLTVAAGTGQTGTPRIVSAANTFLATLDANQRQRVMFAFDDKKQRSAAMALLASALSPRGLEKVEQIMEGDEVNKVEEANNDNRRPSGKGGPPRGAGAPPTGNGGPPDGPPPGTAGGRPTFGRGMSGNLFGKDLYYISFLGTPSEKTPWKLQFGGHHLSLNITIDGERGVLTPTLTGAQPALYTSEGKTVRPLGRRATRLWRYSMRSMMDSASRRF